MHEKFRDEKRRLGNVGYVIKCIVKKQQLKNVYYHGNYSKDIAQFHL